MHTAQHHRLDHLFLWRAGNLLKHLLQHLWLNVGEVPRHVNPENGEEFSKVFNPFGIRVFVDPVEEWYVHQIVVLGHRFVSRQHEGFDHPFRQPAVA